ncbi:MAG TPA: hypothetical protein PLO51_02805, partial [Candidatus Micrarchaeota archaeon]|nr:hypothetical protein [Candidatus Micrarchaeota archaeon]
MAVAALAVLAIFLFFVPASFATVNSTYYGNIYYNVTVNNVNRSIFAGVIPIVTVEANRTPHIITFNGRTPDFTSVPDVTDVRNLTLEKVGLGAISYPSNQSVNVLGADIERNVIINKGIIGVNSSALNPTFNSSVLIQMNLQGLYSGALAPTILYSPGVFTTLKDAALNGQSCVSLGFCTNISWNNTTGILTFNAPHFSGYAVNVSGILLWAQNSTLGINITSTNQIAVYTSNRANDSTFSFIPVTPPAAGSVTLISNSTSNTTGGELGFLVENQGNVNVSITVASDKNAGAFIGGSTPLFQMFGGTNKTG